jgi:cyclopropane-fatty-acyl-phospholipid synthase
MSLLGVGIEWAERGWLPDGAVRWAIGRLCRERLADSKDPQGVESATSALAAKLRESPIALSPAVANEQHYEVPAAFFTAMLGPRRKYSCCYFENASTTLVQAEEAALDATSVRAEIEDGQRILDLGCGWGSLTIWMAERYPNCSITAVSNSHSQRAQVEKSASERGLANVRVVTADMNEFSPGEDRFDRVVSVEMFEHMRNYDRLLARIAGWLAEDGKLFVHHFCHRTLSYPFETAGSGNWMGRHFFTGGLMPSAGLLRQFARDLVVTKEWRWSGEHYRRTAEAWLAQLDRRRHEVMPILEETYGKRLAERWFHRWRLFLLAVAEVFGFASGSEWGVGHYLMERRAN